MSADRKLQSVTSDPLFRAILASAIAAAADAAASVAYEHGCGHVTVTRIREAIEQGAREGAEKARDRIQQGPWS